MTDKPRILLVGEPDEASDSVLARLGESVELVCVRNPIRAFARLSREDFAGVYVASRHLREAVRLGKLLQNERILEGMPDGVVAAGRRQHDHLGQRPVARVDAGATTVVGANFYTVLGSPEILGPDFCPFHTALATGRASSSTLRSGDNRYFQVHAAPVHRGRRPAAAPDRHRPRRDRRDAAAAEAGRHPPGRHRAGRPDARRAAR